MLGRFLELSVPTADIRASVEFYERLGFSHAATGDIWNYPYGVVTDGRITLGLHQNVRREPAITFVRAGVARHASELERVGYRIAYRRTGAEEFHEVGLRDPGGALVTVLEARTYSPVDRRPEQLPHCGYFAELTLPQPNFAAAQRFWDPLGFVATEELAEPYTRQTLTSDHLDLAFHDRQLLSRSALVYVDEDMGTRIARLREAGLEPAEGLPSSLDPADNALFESPEGTLFLLIRGST